MRAIIRQAVTRKQKPDGERGQGLVEYALILVLVAVAVIVALTLLGPVVGNVFSNIVNSFAGIGGGDTTAACVVSHGSFGSAEVPSSVRQGGDNGTWEWISGGTVLRHRSSGQAVYSGGWIGGASPSGDCSPL